MTDPIRIDVRAYDVGFGDCLLVSFTYAKKIDGRASRHVLIDFGSNKYPPHGPKLGEVAARIGADVGPKLDVVVVTHRHRDHLLGFDPTVGGEVIAQLRPDAVLRPWTEIPDPQDPPLSIAERDVLSALTAGQKVASDITSIAFAGGKSPFQSNLLDLAGMQLRNAGAIALLDGLASGAAGRYLRYGDKLQLDMLPGVKVHVLGPPDPKVWPRIRQQAAQSSEYWLGAGAAAPTALRQQEEASPVTVLGAEPDVDGGLLEPGAVRWFIDHLDEHQPRATLRLIHALDAVLNNTSLILAFETIGHTLLFPGDAQIENWSYCLEAAPERPPPPFPSPFC